VVTRSGAGAGLRAALAGPAVLLALLAGCTSTPAATAPAAVTSAEVAAPTTADPAAQYASDTPPAAALMLCSDDVRAEVVAAALGASAVPTPHSTWADHVYTCTYPLPQGPLVLAVTVTPSAAAAADALQAMRGQLGDAAEVPDLGERAYGAAAGTVIAGKDNMVLRVDATGLPGSLGPAHQDRLDFARVVAAGVFTCWTGG
jgi:hypothetical protein